VSGAFTIDRQDVSCWFAEELALNSWELCFRTRKNRDRTSTILSLCLGVIYLIFPFHVVILEYVHKPFFYTWFRASWIEFNNCPTRCYLFSLLHIRQG
jgi:hypothetical protein